MPARHFNSTNQNDASGLTSKSVPCTFSTWVPAPMRTCGAKAFSQLTISDDRLYSDLDGDCLFYTGDP